MPKEVVNMVIGESVLLLGAILGWRFLDSTIAFALALGIGLLILFTITFFRDPDRSIPNENGIVVSPADGRVVRIQDSTCGPDHDDPVKMISIFLSLWDVHVNRVPISGEVVSVNYRSGRFRPAFTGKASENNEQNIIGIDGRIGRIYVKQIAGTIARRIVCHLRVGDWIRQGDRFGMIRFGSRVDLVLPSSVILRVSEGDRVTAGESVIGVIYEK